MSEEHYIHDYSYEFPTQDEKMDYHLNVLFMELCEIIDTITIFEIVKSEWSTYVKKYARVRTLLFETLPYRIYIGLSKIFTTRKDEYSLRRAVNIISQLDSFKHDKTVHSLIQKILIQCDQLSSLEAIKVYRDQFYGHLDKDAAFSDCRIDTTIPMTQIHKEELVDIAKTVSALYHACFHSALEHDWNCIDKNVVIAAFFNPIFEPNE